MLKLNAKHSSQIHKISRDTKNAKNALITTKAKKQVNSVKKRNLNLSLQQVSNSQSKKLMRWNVQNVKAYCFVNRIKVYLAKRYSARHVFRKESVSVSVQNATVNGNQKTFYIIGSASQNSVPVSQISRFKIKF